MRGVNLSKSRVRESFLRVEAEWRPPKKPLEDVPRSTLEAIGRGIEGCMSTWRGVS